MIDQDTDLPPRQRRAATAPPRPESVSAPLPPAPRDFRAAHERLGAMCGHGALAAALGLSVNQACAYFPELTPRRGWVNLPEMERALDRAGMHWRSVRADWPTVHGQFLTGLVIVQWEGSWLEPGVPPAAACRYTHWIATSAGLVYDVNLDGWTTRSRWEWELAGGLRRELAPRSTGWRVKKGYEIAKGLRE